MPTININVPLLRFFAFTTSASKASYTAAEIAAAITAGTAVSLAGMTLLLVHVDGVEVYQQGFAAISGGGLAWQNSFIPANGRTVLVQFT